MAVLSGAPGKKNAGNKKGGSQPPFCLSSGPVSTASIEVASPPARMNVR
jgi:hypothetical protein